MSGDCGHGWGYHYNGPDGPCFKCEQAREHERLSRELAQARELLEAAQSCVQQLQIGDDIRAFLATEGER